MTRKPARRGTLAVLGVPLALAIAACGLLDPFPDLAAAPSDDASAETSASTDDSGTTMGDASACVIGTTRSCGFEACTGTEQCQTDGGWTACSARKPSHERCDTAFDESCDGVGSCTGDGRWARAFGDTRAQEVRAMATDDDGNVYVVGFFDGNLAFDLPDGSALPNGGNDLARDGFLLKLSRSGVLEWARGIPDSRLDAVALRGKEIVVGGTLNGSMSLPGCGALSYAGGGDVLVARYDSNGNCLKAARYGDDKIQALSALAVDPVNHDIVAVGTFTGDLAFAGPGDAGGNLSNPSPTLGYVVRLDGTTLEGRNAKPIPGMRIEVTGVTVTPDQRAVVVGWFIGARGLSNGARDGLFAIVDPSGSLSSLVIGAEASSFSPLAVTFDRNRASASHGVIVTGLVSGSVTLPGGTVLETPSTYGGMFTARVPTSRLGEAWTARWYGAEGLERPYAVATDLEGNIVLAGEVSGRADLGGGTFELNDFDAFVAKYDPLLAHRWSHVFGGAGHQTSWAVATDPLGDVFVGGSFEGATTFGDGGTLLEAGVNANAFVLRRRP